MDRVRKSIWRRIGHLHSLKYPGHIQTRSLSRSGIPDDSWDSHMHVCEPKRFPLSESATYQPHAATLASARKNSRFVSLPNMVFVQPSAYGTDNSCLLWALEQTRAAHGRGVVVVDAGNPPPVSTLREWHDKGVRGIRLNLKSVNRVLSPTELAQTIQEHARVLNRMGNWALQLYVDMSVVPLLAPLISNVDFKVVLDHFGSPSELKPDLSTMHGWDALLNLMQTQNNFYVKISAPYRFTTDPAFHPLEAMTKELLFARQGNGVVFASDWPHTRFEGVDVLPWIDRCLEWCGQSVEIRERLFRKNAQILWDVPHDG